MASIVLMSHSATVACRRRMNTAANMEAVTMGALGQAIKPAMKQVEATLSHRPIPYPGFAAETPMVMRPLMMIDPSTYHHMRRWAVRIVP